MDESRAEPPGDQELGLEVEDEELVKDHPRHRRLVALVIAAFLLAMTILAAGYSLLRAPPTPSRTRPLPVVVPTQGAVH
jgi:hypothetical protein